MKHPRMHATAASCLTLSACVVMGCVRDGDVAVRTVEYYQAHTTERSEELRRCENNAGSTREQPNCINARTAERIESVGSLRDLPALGLPTTPSAQKPSRRPASSPSRDAPNGH